MTTALVLAGHGSHIIPETAGIVWRYIDALRALGSADEITAAFWKEMPSFHSVFTALTADDVTVVPVFTANGYFTQTVIPAEMGLDGTITRRDGRLIRVTPPLSDHPHLFTLVRARVEAALAEHALDRARTAVVVIGHSTRRSPESRRATEAQAARLRAEGAAAEVAAVYLDDVPEIAALYTLTTAPNVIAVPYFLAAGSHTTIDVPRAIGLADGCSHGLINGRSLFYTPPLGTDDALLDVVIALARDAGAPLYPHSPPGGSAWRGIPAAGRDLLNAAVAASGVMRFGGLRLAPDLVCAWDDPHPQEAITTPAELRRRVREQPFRSLATADDLPGGWRVELTEPEQLHAVVETIYPGAVGEWAAAARGALPVSSVAHTAARQTGMYRALDSLSTPEQAHIVGQVCAGCVRHPTWFDDRTGDSLPCPEPCNHWLSAALENAP
ncbi:MAG: CbiX/SirB N-terminal domain-containing protein [bacterium]|nr:CbiX/SirB N-terminal domain-containing protein [bacterium]